MVGENPSFSFSRRRCLYFTYNKTMEKLKQGDIVYFIESSTHIRQATVLKNSAGFCTIRFDFGNCGASGIRVRESKVFKSEQEAKNHLKNYKKQ